MRPWTLAVIALLVGVGAAPGRPIGVWPYETLLKEADVVVIVTAGQTRDAPEPPESPWKKDSVGVVTPFAVKAALKGDAPAGKLELVHYRLKDVPVVNGPLLVVFRPQADYLLFLKRRAGGRYEPVAGMTDPALSVKTVSDPR